MFIFSEFTLVATNRYDYCEFAKNGVPQSATQPPVMGTSVRNQALPVMGYLSPGSNPRR